jgi:hypothetical protein
MSFSQKGYYLSERKTHDFALFSNISASNTKKRLRHHPRNAGLNGFNSVILQVLFCNFIDEV